MRTKERKDNKKNLTNRFCTLVVCTFVLLLKQREANHVSREPRDPLSQGPPNGGGFQTGGVPFLSFLGTSRFFSRIFPICSGMVRGFPRFVPFLFLGLFKSTYEEQSRKGPRHNLDLCRKKWETPRFGNPAV